MSDKKKKKSEGCCAGPCCTCLCFRFENVLCTELAVLIMHLFATFVLYNIFMFVPIVFIRVPRLIFRLLDTTCMHSSDSKRKQRRCCTKSILFLETWFRLISAIVMIFLSLAIQALYIF